MARYKVLERSFINNRLYEEGDVIEYDGKADGNLELLDKPKKATKPESVESDDTPL